ncbi:MAG: 1-deoxy-D-xylulose 5-phosphate reductoisomerase [Parachlamydiales bacterium]|nr:1-deoxy-D-xylulose 5-phosphate reductoisomerase [Parachlamydiales bacterium]
MQRPLSPSVRKIALLGSTGSIGQSALQVVRHLPENLQIVALAARSSLDLLEQQVHEFRPAIVAVGDEQKAREFQKRVPHVEVVAGTSGLCQAASHPDADIALFAMSGSGALMPAIEAIRARKQIALANKEILVSAGELIMRLARENGVAVIPVDSEHSALFQCLQGQDPKSVRRLILTASGGPFRTYSAERLSTISVTEALSHPNWKMGAKITIDSSTLMNKGLELIEARWLFDVPIESVEVIVHPQSVVHSMVEYCDGSILAQMSQPDMVLPIQYALTWPERKPGLLAPFDFSRYSHLTFEAPDRKKFPCLALAEEALRRGQSYPCFLNAANEVLVERLIRNDLRWADIGFKLEKLMSFHRPVDMVSLESILLVDQEARELSRKA